MKNVPAVSLALAALLSGAFGAMACSGTNDAGTQTASTIASTEPPPVASPASTTPTSTSTSTSAEPPLTTPPPGNSTFTCGKSACITDVEECCFAVDGAAGNATPGGLIKSCVAKGSCNGFVALSCNATSCATGQQCCLDTGGPVSTSSCKSTCGSVAGVRSLQLCAASSDCQSGSCTSLQPGIKTCAIPDGDAGVDAGDAGPDDPGVN